MLHLLCNISSRKTLLKENKFSRGTPDSTSAQAEKAPCKISFSVFWPHITIQRITFPPKPRPLHLVNNLWRGTFFVTKYLGCSEHQANIDRNQPGGISAPKIGYYIGETSRSFHERMAEHSEDAKKFSHGSHIIKHWMDQNPASREMPVFKYKIRATFKDCLTRQTTEAVAIMLHDGALLNGKNDYLTNCIIRVRVEEEKYERKR